MALRMTGIGRVIVRYRRNISYRIHNTLAINHLYTITTVDYHIFWLLSFCEEDGLLITPITDDITIT
jgi:hypothetical protein